MNIGARITFTPAPMNMVTIARVGYPDARITLLQEQQRFINTSPGSMYIMKSWAQGRVRSLAPKSLKMSSMKMANIDMQHIPRMRVMTMLFPKILNAMGLLPCPRTIEMRAAQPAPISIPRAVDKFMTGNVTANPAMASGPTPWPMKMRSTILYSDITTTPTIAGRLYFQSSFPTGACSNSNRRLVFSDSIIKL